jgi:hypothetical protein
LPTWYNPFLLYPVGNLSLPFWSVLIPLEYTPLDVGVARAYQKYLVSHARTGNPNMYSDVEGVPPAIEWPLVGDGRGEFLTKVLNVTDTGFELVVDLEDYESVVGFWVCALISINRRPCRSLRTHKDRGSVAKSEPCDYPAFD